jgi:DMSO/TMAO reductase YedYZ molybdopterin-dependent catalytic subunit
VTGNRPDRRGFLIAGAAAGLGPLLGGCDRFAGSSARTSLLHSVERFTYRVHRALLGADRLAPEFSEADITANFKANGTIDPPDRSYRALAARSFADWRLRVDGLVETSLDLSLADLRAMPSRTQITRHDCVEGWSCIGKWSGVPLSAVLAAARVKPDARFVVFHCADTMEGGDEEELELGATSGGTDSMKARPRIPTLDNRAIRYYESIDLIDALHPQTILAYGMNGAPLPVAHGAPLRLRVERQLGYKMAKYVMRLELVDSFAGIGEGQGGYWEDRGYEWYAGI